MTESTTATEDKIRKLLRLAAGTHSTNEAAAAYGRAQDLATRHLLDLDSIDTEIDDEPPPPPRDVGECAQHLVAAWNNAVAWKANLGLAVAAANACRVYKKPGTGLYIYGPARELATACTMYAQIEPQIEALAVAAIAGYRTELIKTYGSVKAGVNDGEDTPRIYGRSFRLGCAHEISLRLTPANAALKEARDNAATPGALVRIDAASKYLARVESAVEDYRATLGLSKGRGFSGARSGGGYAAGRVAGANVSTTTKPMLRD